MTREEIIAEAVAWIGTRWQHQASCKGVGTDCVGFIAGVAANCDSPEARVFLNSLELRRYGRTPAPEFMYKCCDEFMERIPSNEVQIADIMLFRQGNHPMHFGFLAPNNTMIHAWAVARKVVKHQLDAQWKSRIIRTYRLRGIV